jgi:hypothetical protein
MVEIPDDEHYGATLEMPIVGVEKLKLITKYSKGIETRPADPPTRARSWAPRRAETHPPDRDALETRPERELGPGLA